MYLSKKHIDRRAVLQGIEQESELGTRLFGSDVECPEHLGLHFLAMNPHRSAAQFPAVEDQVVGLGRRLARLFAVIAAEHEKSG